MPQLKLKEKVKATAFLFNHYTEGSTVLVDMMVEGSLIAGYNLCLELVGAGKFATVALNHGTTQSHHAPSLFLTGNTSELQTTIIEKSK